MKNELLKLFLLFISAISLHSAHARPLQSVLEQPFSNVSQLQPSSNLFISFQYIASLKLQNKNITEFYFYKELVEYGHNFQLKINQKMVMLLLIKQNGLFQKIRTTLYFPLRRDLLFLNNHHHNIA